MDQRCHCAAPPDDERLCRLRCAMHKAGLDALMCALPSNVLLITGYWPVVGTSIAVATAEGGIAAIVPEDEEDLARERVPGEIIPLKPASLDEMRSLPEAVRPQLREALERLGVASGRIGHDAGGSTTPAPYAALHVYGETLLTLLRDAAPTATPVDASQVLRRLRSRLTPTEVARVRRACEIAGSAFARVATILREGETEHAAAAKSSAAAACAVPPDVLDRDRAHAFFYCMSGPNAALAAAAYQRSRGRRLRRGDLALVHCNSCLGGYWTDITRTFFLGSPDEQAFHLSAAVAEARAAALDCIAPGVRAADVDRVARGVMERHGLGDAFKHATGHGVGFSAIDHDAPPRIHPASPDVLEEGMVFNIEPAAYFSGYGGLRHCDVVAVTDRGADVLTPFLCDPERLTVQL